MIEEKNMPVAMPATARSFSAAFDDEDEDDDPLGRVSSLAELFAANEPSVSVHQDRPHKHQRTHTHSPQAQASSGAATVVAPSATSKAAAEYWCKHAKLKKQLPAVFEALQYYKLRESQLLQQERAGEVRSPPTERAEAARCVRFAERCIAVLEEDELTNSPKSLHYIKTIGDAIMKLTVTRLAKRGSVDAQTS